MLSRMVNTAVTELGRRVAGEIRAEMARQRVAGTKLSRRMGVTDMWLSRRLRGDVGITMDELDEIARALGVPWWQLLPPLSGQRAVGGPTSNLTVSVRKTDDQLTPRRPGRPDLRIVA